MIAMGAGCVANHYGQSQSILPLVERAVQSLIDAQRLNGSFNGNVVSTALAIQAMSIPGLSVDTKSAKQLAIDWLKSVQSRDGSFHSDLLATTEAILALSPKGGRAKIHLTRCERNLNEIVDPSSAKHKDHQMVSFKVLIWVGQPIVQQQAHHLQVPANETLFRALETARSDSLFR